MELIKILDRDGVQVVSARDLHAFLESKKQFADWIKNRIQKYGLVEDEDFTTFHQMVNRSKTTEYALTLDAAKELAMVEGNVKGKEARQYFIQCEKKLKEAQPVLPKTQGELILMLAQQNVQTEKRLSIIESKVAEVIAKQKGSPTDYFSIAGFASLRDQPIDTNKASALSKRCWTLCKELGYDRHTVPDPRFGKVYIYPKTVLETVFNAHYPIYKAVA